MAYGQNFMRGFLIGLNILFAMLGLALIGIGSYVMIEVKEFSVDGFIISFL